MSNRDVTIFSSSQTGEALEWFSKLPSNNIDCFAHWTPSSAHSLSHVAWLL